MLRSFQIIQAGPIDIGNQKCSPFVKYLTLVFEPKFSIHSSQFSGEGFTYT